MKSRNALTAIALTTSLTLCNTVVLSDSSISLDCVDPDPADIAKQLACYNSELDNLSSLTQSLLAERQRLTTVLQEQTGSALVAIDTKDDQIKQQLQTIKQLRLERSRLSTQLHELKLKSREQQLLKSAEEKLVQNYTQAYLSVADKNTHLTENITALEAALEKQEALTSKLKQRLFAAITQAKQASDKQIEKINLLTEENKKLTANATAATKEYASRAKILTNEVSALRDNRDALSHQLEAADKLLAEQNETIDTLNARLSEARSFADTLQADNNTSQQQIAELDISNSTLKNEVSQLQTLQSELRTEIGDLLDEQDQLADSKAILAAASQSMTDTNTQLRKRLTSTSQLLTSTETEKNKAQKTVSELETKVASLQNLLDGNQQKYETLAASLATIKDELSASNNRFAKRQTQLQGLLQEKESIVKELNKINNETAALAKTIKGNLQSLQSNSSQIALSVQPDNTIVLNIASNQLFRTGSSRLSDEGQQLLASVAPSLAAADSRRILIEGHSDNVPLGPKLSKIFTDNVGLSMARALNAASFLNRESQIPALQLGVSGAGAAKPLASNETEQGRQKNRRVEIHLLPVKAGF